MRAYRESSQEALFTRSHLKDWAGEGFLTQPQYQRMEQETVCDLRRTNIFLRLVLFFFTIIIVAAAIGLFFIGLPSNASSSVFGTFLLIFCAVTYAAAEFSVSRGLYRYGIEEALAVCSLVLFCVGLAGILSSSRSFSVTTGMEIMVATTGVLGSLWIWHRFGLAYAFLAAMLFVPWLSVCWTSSHMARHLIVAAIYAAGLIAITLLRPRYRFTYLNEGYSIAEALLWLGVYIALNLQLSSVDLLGEWLGGPLHGLTRAAEFPEAFYWSTWVMTWCIPAAALWRGVRGKDRFVIAVGALAAALTLVTNKPYLGWQRHTWDPMLMGALLIGIALFLNRWLAKAQGGIRHGFTAQRLSGKDKRWMNAASVAFGVQSTHATTLSPAPDSGVHFGGGDSGGGGATTDF